MPQLHMIGFGSQGAAWAECLRDAGWRVHVYLSRNHGPSFDRARALGFEPNRVQDVALALSNDSAPHALVAMLLPDTQIGPVYRDCIAARLPTRPLTLVLAHGYAVYARDLAHLPEAHELALLAPKAIGPKLRSTFKENFPAPHPLVAGYCASCARDSSTRALAHALGFQNQNLVETTFETEAVGDLISEQALLCGGVLNLLSWTIEAMEKAGVPGRLIREECLTELELIAGLLRARGPEATFSAISQAAQCGTVTMGERLKALGVDKLIATAAAEIASGRFVETLRASKWREQAQDFKNHLASLEKKL